MTQQKQCTPRELAWMAALEKENPDMRHFAYHIGVNPDHRQAWYPYHTVLFNADVNVAHRLMDQGYFTKRKIREVFCDANEIADAAIVRAMK